jgi:hypothetical protein
MKRKFYHFLMGCSLLIAGGNTLAQTTPATRNCSTMEVYERQLQADPGFKVRREAIEAYTQRQINKGQLNHRTGVITIPVVVHVVYNTTAQNISDAQIQSQINILNQDFRKLNADVSQVPSVWSGLATDAQVEFCLAKRDPSGSATTGITRTQTTKTSFTDAGDYIKYTSQGGKDAWDRNQYLNLWVGNLSGGLLGYAQFPGGPAATDGVVCTYTGFGNTGTAASPFNLGRTATHEIGHWLNLYHIWGDDGTGCTGSDQCADTPNQGGSNGGCPSFPKISCSNTPNGDMWMNYMDYTDDRCMYMFTTGQKGRMDAVLDVGGTRASLATSQGCVAPGGGGTCTVPTGLTTSALTSTSVTLNWAASGATSYNVQIKATSNPTWSSFTATSNSLSLTGLTASTAYEFQVAGVCSGSTSAFSGSYIFTAPASGGTGSAITVGTGSTGITQAPYGTYYMDQRVQYIITKAELTAAGYTTGSSLSSLAFYVSSAQSQVMNAYTIKMAHTTSSAFASSSYLTGTNVTTSYTGNYTAVGNSWNTHTFSTPFVYNGTSNILIDICFNNSSYTQNSTVLGTALASYRSLYKQQDVASGGICTTTTGTLSYNRPNMKLTFGSGSRSREITVGESPIASLVVFPNPVNAEMSLNYSLTSEHQNVQLEIYNLVGKLIYTQDLGTQTEGVHSFAVPMDAAKLANLPNGMYICRLRNAGEVPQTRFVISR